MEVEIAEMRLITGAGALLATCDVELSNGIKIYGVKLIKTEGKPLKVFMPQASWMDKSGQVHYQNVLRLPEELQEAVNKVVLDRYGKKGEGAHG